MNRREPGWAGKPIDIFQAVINQLYCCEAELLIYRDIADNAEKINEEGFGLFFETTKVVCARSVCLILCNLFNRAQKKHILANFEEIIARLKDFKIRDEAYIRKTLSEWAANEAGMDHERIIELAQRCLRNKIKMEKRRNKFSGIKSLRNTGIAHGEMKVSSDDEFDYESARTMLDFSHEIANFFNRSFVDLYIEDKLCHQNYAQRCSPNLRRLFERIGIKTPHVGGGMAYDGLLTKRSVKQEMSPFSGVRAIDA